MNIKFSLTLTAYAEAMSGPIPIGMEANVEAACEYNMEREVRYDSNGEGCPGSESVDLIRIRDVTALVDWYTAAPDGTMTVYHHITFTLEGEDAARWLDAWKVDIEDAIAKEEISYEDIMD